MNTKTLIQKHALNPMIAKPKTKEEINKGLKVLAYRNKRLDFWRVKVGNGDYTTEVRVKASDDCFRKFGVK